MPLILLKKVVDYNNTYNTRGYKKDQYIALLPFKNTFLLLLSFSDSLTQPATIAAFATKVSEHDYGNCVWAHTHARHVHSGGLQQK